MRFIFIFIFIFYLLAVTLNMLWLSFKFAINPLVNSAPLSVCTHFTSTPRVLKLETTLHKNKLDE